ncbi:hypothetical protein AWB76_07198 [Caballeronia temeraria]|uniref:Uncharacterized protein n=1 Tax=Caballeronia temeraria TaxID=1777137 RepID=A0A158DMG4_9BURK|nr:hypothetical protein [Caballeronia temeraria]SAK95798.1 hypothetical protein AWB76_07198 [Caballeronia temeraria]
MDNQEFGTSDPMPLDVAVGFMALGYDLNTLEDRELFDPYFND